MNWQSFKPLFSQDWWKYIQSFIESEECDNIYKFLKARSKVVSIVPESKNTWRAFSLCKWDNLKAVLIGQDPYPQKGVADGLAFSHPNEPLQPSLELLLQAIEDDCYGGMNLRMSIWSELDEFAKDGVLLLNYSLTTEIGNPGAHRDLWELFHKYLIEIINKNKDDVVFILLGSKAQQLRKYINEEKHMVLEAEHPSRAARENRKMQHNNVFSKCNAYLKERRNEEVDWARTLPF